MRVHRRSADAAVRKILLTRISKRCESFASRAPTEKERERERERERDKRRARVARKWSSFGDSRYRAGEKSGCQSSLILFLLLPSSPLFPRPLFVLLTKLLFSLRQSARFSVSFVLPRRWRSFPRVGCLARQGSRKEGCGEMCLGGAVHPWRQHGPRKGGKKGARRVRRPPFFGIKRVTRVTVRGEIESERDVTAPSPRGARREVDPKEKGRREETGRPGTR